MGVPLAVLGDAFPESSNSNPKTQNPKPQAPNSALPLPIAQHQRLQWSQDPVGSHFDLRLTPHLGSSLKITLLGSFL